MAIVEIGRFPPDGQVEDSSTSNPSATAAVTGSHFDDVPHLRPALYLLSFSQRRGDFCTISLA
jgi:hypothetical protein